MSLNLSQVDHRCLLRNDAVPTETLGIQIVIKDVYFSASAITLSKIDMDIFVPCCLLIKAVLDVGGVFRGKPAPTMAQFWLD